MNTNTPVAAFAPARSRSVTGQLLLVVMGAVLIWLCAQIRIPFWPVPATLQTLAVFLIAGSLGVRLGLAATMLYLTVGFAGLPVFTGGAAGLATLSGATGGYLIGFPLAAIFLGLACDRGMLVSTTTRIAALIYASAIVFVPGVVWLDLYFPGPLEEALALGLFPFLPGAVVKIAIASVLLPAATIGATKLR